MTEPILFCTECGRPTVERVTTDGDGEIVWRQCPKWMTFPGYLRNPEASKRHTLQSQGRRPILPKFDPQTGGRLR